MHSPWKNGGPYIKPVRELMRQYVHIRRIRGKLDCLMSESFEKVRMKDIRNDDMPKALKLASIKLAYQEIKGIEITDINTHLIRAIGRFALHLAEYKDR